MAADFLLGNEFPLSQSEWRHAVHALRLSPQQAKIVALILRGMQDKQIAVALGNSLSTIRTHMRQLFARHGVAHRTQLAVLVFTTVRRTSPDRPRRK